MRALLIANATDLDAGFVGERFRSHGYAFDECHREHPGDWPALDGHELVVMLGSEWSVYWPEVADHVAAEVAVVREAARRGVPIFGICFGNQVLAHALGGTVYKAPEPEIGWMGIDTDLPAVIAAGPWMQWHYDVVTLPGHATELARSAAGPQAWRLGRVFATQFHPEANEAMLRRWTTGFGADELKRIGSSAEQLMATTQASVGLSRPNTDRLVDWFCESIVPSEFHNVVDTP
ncbi:MAG: type 1 glutamine amidotransferase [Actinomycetota bacterium]|nr:type 1 glutamine amidotransferase [Actinomycetota bacterium]